MTIDQFHIGFKLQLDKSNSLQYVSFLPEEIDYWLNEAQIVWVKTRYTGNNHSRTSFEQTEKRIDDLRDLIVETEILTTDGIIKPNSFNAILPNDYWFNLSDECEISFSYPGISTKVIDGKIVLVEFTNTSALVVGNTYKVNGTITHDTNTLVDGTVFIATTTSFSGSGTVTPLKSKRQGITETNTDRYRDAIDNNFSNHILHYYHARPLLLYYDGDVELISDGNYHVRKYFLRYLRKPLEISNITKEVQSGEVIEGSEYVVKNGSVLYNQSSTPVVEGDTASQITSINVGGITLSNSDNYKFYWSLSGYASTNFIDGDTYNQLSDLELNGVNLNNSDNFKLYWSINKVNNSRYQVIFCASPQEEDVVAYGEINSSSGTVTITNGGTSSGISGVVTLNYTQDAAVSSNNKVNFVNLKLYKDSSKTQIVGTAYLPSLVISNVNIVAANASGLNGATIISYTVDDTDSLNLIKYNGVYTPNTSFVGVLGATSYTKLDTAVKVYLRRTCELPDHAHNEILKLAVNMVLENLGDVQRYQTNSIEVQNME